VDEIHVNPHSLSVIDTMEDIVHETLTIHLGETLVKGTQYRISMKFVSVLNDQLRGFYRSSYVENGIEKYIIDNALFILIDADFFFKYIFKGTWLYLRWNRQMRVELFHVLTSLT